MIKENLKKLLIDNLSNHNIKGLISYMELNDFDYHLAELKGPLAMATFKGVYIDIRSINNKPYNENLFYFILLHETAHMKRMKKFGKTKILEMLSHENFDVFFNHVINEELIADRYGCYIYKKLNNKIFPEQLTQQLNLDYKKEKYKSTIKNIFGVIKNDEKKYDELFNQYIIKIH